LELRGELLSSQFAHLIQDIRRNSGEKVAVIIDEYDKPLLSTIDHSDAREDAEYPQGFLRGAEIF
jgi:hypothetical protein